MKIECKDGYEIGGFKISDVVSIAIARMKTLTDFKNKDSYYTHTEFANLCFETLKLELQLSRTLKLKHLKDVDEFVDSCKIHFHIRKSRDFTLRCFRTHGDGSVFIRYDIDTNPKDVEAFDRQARDRIASHHSY